MFVVVVEIYCEGKHVHGIVVLLHVILAKDEMKVEGRVAWEQYFDTLSRFCGPKGRLCVCVCVCCILSPLWGLMKRHIIKIWIVFILTKLEIFLGQ